MLLTSNSFLFLFLPVSLMINFFNINKKIKTVFLGVVSGYFYFIDNGYLIVILIFLSILMKYQIQNQNINNFIFISLLLSPLFVFKYSFVFFKLFQIDVPAYIQNNFPIGLSFFTFQAIAYYFDKERLRGEEDSFEIFTFLTFFPQLLAGPIVDIATYRRGVSNTNTSYDFFLEGTYRISIGLLKKFFLADTLSQVTLIYTESLFGFNFSYLSSAILILSYTFQIYFDFSAYCDIAIGIALLFGFKLPENFNKPYLSSSFQEFWRRWHITLSNFFKNFIYIPLGGNRVSRIKHYRNLWITFLLTALWHGATFNFILWGILHGFFLTFEKLINFNKLFSNKLVTFMLVSLTWVPFFSLSFGDTINILSSLFVLDTSSDTFLPILFQFINFKFLIVSIICALSLLNIKINFKFKNSFLFTIPLFILSIFIVLSSSVDPFIYFRF